MSKKVMSERLILVTNDDGVAAPGVHILSKVLSKFGRVVCVCPERQQSCQSMALTVMSPITYEKVTGNEDYEIYKVNGTPVDCVALAISKIIGINPDFMAAGINLGSNASANMLFSGTMGAVTMSCLFGVPSVGFSLDTYNPAASFDHCLPFIDRITDGVIKNGLPAEVCLNVNIPYGEKIPEEMKLTSLCKGKWIADYKEIKDIDGKVSFRPFGHFVNEDPYNQDTDIWCLEHNVVSVTPVMFDRTYPDKEKFKWI